MSKTLHRRIGHHLLLALLLFSASAPLSAQSNALHFDGTNDYVACPAINPTQFTVEAWVYPTLLNRDQPAFSTLSETANTGMELHIADDNKPLITIRNGGGWLDVKATSAVSLNTWVHLAATYNGSNVKLYVNGAEVQTATATDYTPGSKELYIGKRTDGNASNFAGRIDEVRIWNTARTQTEIADAMNTSLNGSETGLLALYQFDQGTANGSNASITTLTDATSNAKHGTVTNFALTGATSNWVEGVNFSTFVPLTVTITKTDETQAAVTDAASLQDAIGAIPLGEVKKIVITGGTFTYIDWIWLQNNRSSLTNLTHFTITNGAAAVADIPGTYQSNPYFGAQLQELRVAKMEDVGEDVLSYCTSLTTLDLPNVTRIKYRAFMGCSSLVNLYIPNINQIYSEAFENCTSLTSVLIPNAFNIGAEAFKGCTRLANLMLRAAPPISYASAFEGCPTPRYLAFADANGNLLTGTELESARAAYKGVNDGDTTDDLWYGWAINRNLYIPGIDPAMVNGSLTAGNPEAELYGRYPAGVTLFITVNPAAGYKLTPGSLRVYKTGDESAEVSLEGNSFTMPDFEVTVTALFEPLPLQVTFVAATSGNIPVGLVLESGAGRIAVDKGDGVLAPYELDPDASFFYVMSYVVGNTVSIYSDNIAVIAFQTPLIALDVSRATTLTQLICPNTQLNFATLPQPKFSYTWYWYSPQQNLDVSCTNGIVDLSSQLTALDVAGNTQNTVYTWYLTDGTALVEDVDYKSSGGVFLFLKVPASDVYCSMTNATFPDLTLRTVDIAVDAVVEPAITFVSQKDGELLIAGRTLDRSSILVDWGDGTLVADGDVVYGNRIQFSTSSYVAGSTVKIYGNLFEDVDLSGYDYNEEDYTIANEVVSLNVSRATTLDVLYCEKNNLTELDVSNNTALRVLYIESNNLSGIDVSKNTMLEVLSLYDNTLTFASLPQRKISYNTYDYQPQHDLAATCTFGIVDLSSQLTAVDVDGNTQNTVYTWFLEDETPLVVDVDYTVSNGVFYFQQLPDSPVYCLMTNSAFPDLTLRTVDITVDMVAPTPITWTGAEDLSWHNPLNWDLEVVPDQTHIVTVPVGPKYPIIWVETTASCHSITLKGDATGIASVINYGTLNAVYGVSVERYAPAGAFEYISSPVENKTAKVFAPLATKPADGNGLFAFNVSANAWSAPITNAETPLTAMKGFAFIAKESGKVTFNGDAFHSGNQSIALTKTVTTGFNLVGNPYPSAINWGSMSGWERENVNPVIWINYADAPGDANFASYNHLTPDAAINWLGNVGSNLGSVAPTQSFWVLAEADGATLTVKPNAQVISTNVVNKKSADTNPLIRLQAQRSGYSDEMVIFFHPEATEGMNRYDTRKRLGSGAYPQLYAPVADAIAAVNTLPQSLLSEKVVVPITLKSDMAGSITMALTELKNLGDDMNIILTDKATGSQTDLRTAAYTVEVEAGSTLTNRFEVIIERKNTTSAPAIDKSTVNIYASAKNIYVGMAQQGSRVEVYNAIGVQMLSHTLNGTAVESIPTSLPKGVYIVVVNGSEGRTVKRIFIN
ncbi:MAG: LamG-like jellyroll fold domain-containing protein [Tenuifilaceae bacterium]|jgi:Leucine-rich repeat (LRR) protein|nr:LamG-like jellyroll fold domain-containing protein [Tenuifilaceae bacterium]